MEGVILFADDHIFDYQSPENNLFHKFNSDGSTSILPINNLNILDKTVLSISTYKALILDWNFKRVLDIDEDGLKMPDETPYAFLKSKKIYSLVYIYSQDDIAPEIKDELQSLYPGKIFFEKKDSENETDIEYKKIIDGIKKFEDENKHLALPFIWSQAINKSAQVIFSELELADPNWIKDLYYSSYLFDRKGKPMEPPPIDPNVQVINLFQNILSEHLIQNKVLRDEIENFSTVNFEIASDPDKLKNLYQYLYYTKTPESDAIMTGDIFDLDGDMYGVVISPECDMNTLINKDKNVELLCFEKNDFRKIDALLNIKKDEEIRDSVISRAYNQEPPRIHLLPNFINKENESITALIDFRFCLELYKGSFLKDNLKCRRYKINSPYIQQLRQRYLSYVGRVGVPAIPQSLRFFNLK